MKRLFLCVMALLVLQSTAFATVFEATLSNGDQFYYEQYENAILPTESSVFEIGFRVCKLPQEQQAHADMQLIQYDLILSNKTDETLKNVSFKVHLQDPLQMILIFPQWYNEPMDIGARDNQVLPHTAIYTWNPLVVLKDVGFVGSIELSDFYDFLIEVSWDDGYQVIRVDQEAVYIPEAVRGSLEQYEALDIAEVDAMLARGIEMRREIYGE